MKVLHKKMVSIQVLPWPEFPLIACPVWNYLWNNIQHADLFISHPVNKFVPDSVPIEKVALLPASTDWYEYLYFWLNFLHF